MQVYGGTLQYSKYMKAQLQSIICAPLLGQSDIHLVQKHRNNIQRRQEHSAGGIHTCKYDT